MKDNIERMDKTIKEKFDGHEVPVPSHLWNSIEANLTPGKGNTGGDFFIKNPFLLSMLFISTVIIGTYLYNSENEKTDASATSSNELNSSGNRLNSSSTTYSNSMSYDRSAEGKNTTAGSVSNSETKMNAEEKDQTTYSSAKINAESVANSAPNKDLSKNKNNATDFEHNQYTSNTTASTISTKNTYSAQPQNKNSSASNKNSQQHTINNNVTNNNSATADQSGKTDFTNLSSEHVSEKGTDNNNVHSSSAASNTKSNPSESITTVSAITAKSENTAAQTSSTIASKNNTRSAVHADSIKLFTAACMQQTASFNKTESSESSMLSIDKNTSTENNNTNITNNANNAITSASNQDVKLNAVTISNTLTSLNSNNIFSKPSETAYLYNQDSRKNEVTGSVSANKQFVTHTNASHTSLTSTSIDSVNSRTHLENYLHTNSNEAGDTVLTFTANNSTKELLFKIDSTLLAEHADTSSILKQPETIEAKSSEEEKNKKPSFLSRCSFDGYATPALGYMYLYTNNTNDSTTFFTKDRNKSADPGFGIITGLRMNYALTQKIEIGIGLQYSSLSQKSSFTEEYVDSTSVYQGFTQIDSTYDSISHHMIYSSHFVVTDTTQNYFLANRITKHTDKFQNISIPIHIAYGYSISNKLSLIARTSLLINYQTYSVTYLNSADGTTVGYHSNKNLSLGGSFSVGCYYLLSKKCSVFAEPIVSYYFSNVFDKQASFKQKQLMLGLQAGIRLSF